MIDLAKFKLVHTSHRTLKILAVLVWLVGGVMMLRKSSELFREAHMLSSTPFWAWICVGLGILLGSIKAHFVFRKSCLKNLQRIDALQEPKCWQFYSPQFFLMLALMISAGVMLSRLAHGNFPFLLSVAVLDLSIATALLISSQVFWQERVLIKR